MATQAGAAIDITRDALKWMKNRECLKIVKSIDIEPCACRQDPETTPRERPRPPQAAATGGTACYSMYGGAMGVDG